MHGFDNVVSRLLSLRSAYSAGFDLFRIFCLAPFAKRFGNRYHRDMATVRIVRFSKAALLRRVDPVLFLDFARSFGGFFARNEVSASSLSDLPRD